MYKIEKGIPITQREPNKTKYPFDQMEVGDSFLAPHQHNVHSAFKNHKKKNPGQAIKTRKENGGCRVWRVA